MSDRVLSKARLDRMHTVMAGHVERGDVPGMVTVVSRRGEVHVDVHGTMAFGGGWNREEILPRLDRLTKLFEV